VHVHAAAKRDDRGAVVIYVGDGELAAAQHGVVDCDGNVLGGEV
jgi:hypothetical protein